MGGLVTNAFALFVLFVLAIGVACAIAALSTIIGRRQLEEACHIPYECGLDPVGVPRRRFSVKFFLVAMLFVTFDIGIVFLFPWAYVYRDMIEEGMGMLLFAELAVFVAVLGAGLAYVWQAGALKWED